MKTSTQIKTNHWALRSSIKLTAALMATAALMTSGMSVMSNSAGAALKTPFVSGACNTTVSAGTGTVVGSLIVGVTPGTTKVTFDCDDSSGAAIVAEASLLSAIGTSSVALTAEADTAAIGDFTASATNTGCPAATAGTCTVAVFSVPATFTAGDSKALCPPSQVQIKDGLFGCVLAVATASETPVSSAEYLMTYASQTTVPNAPTIAATPSEGVAGGSVTVSDAASNTGYWWANAIQANQAAALGATATAAPSTCGAGGGYGSVPSPFLEVNWFAAGSATPIAGSAAGLNISNDCYDGTTLHGPVLSGTTTTPSAVKIGTTYKVYVCELNVTAFPSNDASASTDCGAAPGGESWIDASFSFTGALGPITQAAPTSGTTSPGTATSVQLNVTGNSGAVSFISSSTPIAGLTVSALGLVSSSASLAVGSYTISGTDSDTSGDSGTWTYTLSVGTTQAALTLTSVSGTVGNALTLATSGGSGTGAVTFAVTSGTASGCAISGSSLSASSAGTCIVTATKTGDTTYLPVSSTATTVTFGSSQVVKLVSRSIVLASNAKVLSIKLSCSAPTCRGTISVTAAVKRPHSTKSETLTFGPTGYRLNRKSAESVTIRLNGAVRSYLEGNPNRPIIVGSVYVTNSLGEKHSYIGRVTLLK
jgi:hypothetical protein